VHCVQTLKANAYDSDVFRIADGRWILFSTLQTRNGATPLQSTDLYNWTICTDPALQINVGEGPHVTGSSLNDATAGWHGYAWMNWEGTVRVDRQRFTLEDAIEFHAFAPLDAILQACDQWHSSRVSTC
jgi:hypothetical protein